MQGGWADCWRAPLGKHMGAPEVPHATSGTNRRLIFASAFTGANECGSFAPVLFRLSLYGRCIRVLHFKPIGRAAGTVGRVLALRDNAFEPHLAGSRRVRKLAARSAIGEIV